MKRLTAFYGLMLMFWIQTAIAEGIKPKVHLMITDLNVVEDQVKTDPRQGNRAVWSFKYLIEQMAGSQNPSDFVMDWLQQWEIDQNINGHLATARPSIRELIIDPWLQASGGNQLDLNKAPFKLLAIVNRMDLREHTAEGEVLSGGEGRFIFGVLDANGEPLPPTAGPAPGGFTVIFEYGLPINNMRQLGDWAKRWKALDRYKLGSREYKKALERITRDFTDRDQAPEKPNSNALNQIRTNEIALGDTWELREFVISDSSGLLQQKTVAITPDSIQLNGVSELAQMINNHTDSILDGSFKLENQSEAASSVAGPFLPTHFADFEQRTFTKTRLIEGLDFYDIPWSAENINNNEARHLFALNTCNGCHRDETDTGFLHVGFPEENALPNSLGKPAALSAFLTGETIADPVDAETSRDFNELKRRQEDFAELLESFGKDGRGSGPRKQHRPRFVH